MPDPTTYKQDLLRETREELARADTKASILLAASGIAFAALIKDPDKLTHHAARICSWLALAFTLVGICVVAAAVKPRLRTKHAQVLRPDYFGDAEAFRPAWLTLRFRRAKLNEAREAFGKALNAAAASETERSDRLTDQTWHLSHIAYLKYRLVAFGMVFYGIAVVLGVVALIVEKQWL
jgi:Family of unknown function (DUF5706)